MLPTMRLWFLAAAFLLGGCQFYTLAPANQPLQLANSVTVNSPIPWSRHADGSAEVWTVDGHLLHSLMFFSGIRDGEPLAPKSFWLRLGSTSISGEAPTFNSNMTALEVSDLVRETYGSLGAANFTYTNLGSATYGGHDGFQLDFSFSTKEGLEKLGTANGAVIDGSLYMSIYTGAMEHYYSRYQKEVNSIFSSLQLQAG